MTGEGDLTWRDRLYLRWWALRAWFHRCPECGHRPDKHFDSTGPRWEHDRVAMMLRIGHFGCPRCGHGAIAERDAITPPGETTATDEAAR